MMLNCITKNWDFIEEILASGKFIDSMITVDYIQICIEKRIYMLIKCKLIVYNIKKDADQIKVIVDKFLSACKIVQIRTYLFKYILLIIIA